jgi:tetratricopeptide (TPR) repeat protein
VSRIAAPARIWIGPLVFVSAFAVLCACLAPGLYLGDSGELTSAAFTLGVAHETGFPLWCLLAKALSLLPLGEIAFRVNLLSALGGAAAAWLTYVIVRDFDERRGLAAMTAGAGAAALLIAGFTFFRDACVAEVYAPTVAIIALALVLFQRAVRGDKRAARLLAFVGGLSLGLHAQLRILLGPAVALWGLLRLRKGDRWPLLAPAAIALGAAVVAYLPLRAARASLANWGEAETLGGLVQHLSAARIRNAFADEIGSHDLVVLGDHLRRFLGLVEGQLGILALVAALGGLVVLLTGRATRAVGLLLVVMIVGEVLYAVLLNPMAISDLQNGAPLALAVAISAGAGILAAARRAGEASSFAAGALAVVVCVPAALADGAGKIGFGPEAARWTRGALADLPPRALLISTSDDLSAGLLYEQAAGGARPDVTTLVRQQLWDKKLVAARVAHAGNTILPTIEALRWLGRSERDRVEHEGDALRTLVRRELAVRAVAWEPGSDVPPVPAAQIEPGVPVFTLHDGPAPLEPARPLAERVESLLSPGRDPFVRRLEAAFLSSLGRLYLERGDAVRAGGLFETALAVHPADGAAATNLAVVRAQRGDLRGAVLLADDVLERDPLRRVTRLNSARYHLQLGDLDAAQRQFQFLSERARPAGDATAFAGLGRVALRRGDRPEAARLAAHARKLAPADPELHVLDEELRR